jgi:hypothetical protein
MAESAKPPCSPHPALSAQRASVVSVDPACDVAVACEHRVVQLDVEKARRNPGDEAIEAVHAWLDVRLPSSHDLDRRPRVRCHRAVPGASEQCVGERALRAPPAGNRILWDVELEAGAGCGRVGLRRHRRRNRLPARAQSSPGRRLLDAKGRWSRELARRGPRRRGPGRRTRGPESGSRRSPRRRGRSPGRAISRPRPGAHHARGSAAARRSPRRAQS